uniref:Transmembrane protein n=1 Tax=Medicago truncatula TaxID=3880 RepID=I3SUH2_MEDTR|nr:unknown [Medicago truncatula]
MISCSWLSDADSHGRYMHFTALVSSFLCAVPVSTFRLFNSKLNFVLAKVERSPSLSITLEAFT